MNEERKKTKAVIKGSSLKKKLRPIIIALVLLIGIGSRLFMTSWDKGLNYDVHSYIIVAQIMNHDGNVYAETSRYNYGPVWFNIIYAISKTARYFYKDDPISRYFLFRYLLTAFLTCVDLGIFLILWKKYRLRIAVAFLLNPISIIITGFHSQFCNLAVFIGFCSVLIFGENVASKLNRRKIAGLCLLGFSLMTKHLLFLFPLWLAVKQKGFVQKLVVLTLPVFIFIISFLPYWQSGKAGIINNVFLYKSFGNAPFWKLFLPDSLLNIIPKTALFFGTLIILGFIFRNKKVSDTFLLYIGSLIIFSSAITNQYLAIVLPFISVFLNWAFVLYIFIGTYHLLTDPINGLKLNVLKDHTPGFFSGDMHFYYSWAILFLFIGFVWIFQKKVIVEKTRNTLRKIIKSIKYKLMFQF